MMDTFINKFLYFYLIYGSFAYSFKLFNGESSDVGLDPVQMIEKHGYLCETHNVTTEDGYIITVHRIPSGRNELNIFKSRDDAPSKKPSILLMHGLLSSSADYVNMGPDRSLGYILADAGYDVWMPNARGNTFSKGHKSLTVEEDAQKFYNFSWHEIGFYDLAASIDYILELKGDQSLYYVGHSQGSTTFLVLASMRPEYNKKIKSAALMAPASFMEHHQDGITQIIAQHVDVVEVILNDLQVYAVPFLKEVRAWYMQNCENPEYQQFCIDFLFNIGGGAADLPQLDLGKLTVIGTNAPADAAMKQFLHYLQLVKNGGFLLYDYGTKRNLAVYGSERPPVYNLSQISLPVAIYYGINDDLVHSEDAQKLANTLPNVVRFYEVPNELFNHIDFVFAKDVVRLVYNELINVIQNIE